VARLAQAKSTSALPVSVVTKPMSGWQATKGKAAAIGGVGAGSMASRREHTRAVKKHPTSPREAQEAHGRIGCWFVHVNCDVERTAALLVGGSMTQKPVESFAPSVAFLVTPGRRREMRDWQPVKISGLARERIR